MPHRFSELAVAGNADARVRLAAYDVGDGGPELSLEAHLVARACRFERSVRFDQVVGARQASGVTREDAIAAVPHAG